MYIRECSDCKMCIEGEMSGDDDLMATGVCYNMCDDGWCYENCNACKDCDDEGCFEECDEDCLPEYGDRCMDCYASHYI